MTQFGSISEASTLAIYSMIVISRSERMLNASEIAGRLNASTHHVTKVLSLLQQNGLLASLRGPKGGYFLDKSPEDISLLEIYELIDGRFDINGCTYSKKTCPFEDCVFDFEIYRLKMQFKYYLSNKKLSQYSNNIKSIKNERVNR